MKDYLNKINEYYDIIIMYIYSINFYLKNKIIFDFVIERLRRLISSEKKLF